MTTKRQIIQLSFDQLGMGTYVYDMQTEDWTSGLMRLNALMAEWGLSDIATGFPMTDNPIAGELDDDSGLSAGLIRGVSAQLAVDLAPGYGKQISDDTKRAAAQGRRIAIANDITIPTRKIDNMSVPAGAGYKQRFGTVLQSEDENEVLR
ncbi:MAG: hypothetical protein EP341_00840 [Sphingomonadales bacterium]|nr:MAG: hypothetical protein EP341_00840 [Sphingomonadales bacterium]